MFSATVEYMFPGHFRTPELLNEAFKLELLDKLPKGCSIFSIRNVSIPSFKYSVLAKIPRSCLPQDNTPLKTKFSLPGNS